MNAARCSTSCDPIRTKPMIDISPSGFRPLSEAWAPPPLEPSDRSSLALPTSSANSLSPDGLKTRPRAPTLVAVTSHISPGVCAIAERMPTRSAGTMSWVWTPRNGDPTSPPWPSGRSRSVASTVRSSPSRTTVNVTSSPTS